jgi:SAM-dependent methyltransferase
MLAAGLVTVRDDVFAAVPGLRTALHPQAYPVNLRAYLRLPRTVPRLHDDLMGALRDGTGIPYQEQRRASGRLTDELNRPILREHLVRDWIAAVPGLTERLTDGAMVADLGCGTGYATRLLAAAFPTSTFVGIDEDPDAITAATHRPNVTYRLGGLDQLSTVDMVLLVNLLHDLPQPKQAVERIRDSLRPGGYLVVIESSATGDLATDSERPRAVLGYLSSLVHCVQVSLAEGGTGPGARWGPGPVLDALHAARLTDVDSAELPPGRSVFWGRA